jgi:hypothetical protein
MTNRIPKARRDELAKLSVGFVRKLGRKDTAALIRRAAGVSNTTAQHIIRRGIFLSVNQGER